MGVILVHPSQSPKKFGVAQDGERLRIITACCFAPMAWETSMGMGSHCSKCKDKKTGGFSDTWVPFADYGLGYLKQWVSAWTDIPEHQLQITIEETT